MTKTRCKWCEGDKTYEEYHDREWGVPIYEDSIFFEFLILESFQAGLSWITILKKRENFRKAFDDFNYKKIALYDEEKVEELRQNKGIIRNRLKIRAAINNAQRFMEIQKEFGSFSDYIWGFVDHQPIQNTVIDYKSHPPTTKISDQLSKDLKKRGFKFVGSTIIYSLMQATGLVNDHEESCFRNVELGER